MLSIKHAIFAFSQLDIMNNISFVNATNHLLNIKILFKYFIKFVSIENISEFFVRQLFDKWIMK